MALSGHQVIPFRLKAPVDFSDGKQFQCSVYRAVTALSSATHELVSIAGSPMPPGREGPSHSRIRPVIESGMPNMAQLKPNKLL